MEVLVRNGTSSMPGMSGMRARPPTLMKMRGAVSAFVADANDRRDFESRVTLEHRAASHARAASVSTPARALADDGVGARLDPRHVDPDGPVEDDAVLGARRARCAA